MSWEIQIHRKAAKQIRKLPVDIRSTLLLLMRDLEESGPRPNGNWKNYGKLKMLPGDKRHCHVSSSKPTYVCCWEVVDKKLRILEVYYAGIHEKAPY